MNMKKFERFHAACCAYLIIIMSCWLGTASGNCNGRCPANYDPVCGSDGATYSNECEMGSAACRSRTRITVAYRGRCNWGVARTTPRNCNWACYLIYDPICGSDGRTYGNECEMRLAWCHSGTRITRRHRGRCDSRIYMYRTTPRSCNWDCPAVNEPFCGSDGRTYGNECEMKASACVSETRITVAYQGKCNTGIYGTTPRNCEWACPTVYSPLCGSDGRTYSNICEMKSAACNSGTTITVARQGECITGFYRATPRTPRNCNVFCPAVYDTTCGSDGRTYDNECEMRKAACRSGIRITVVKKAPCSLIG